MKSQLTGKDPDAGKDWGQEEKREAEKDSEIASLTQWDMYLSKLQEIVKDREAWCTTAQSRGLQTDRQDLATE